jgi:hypothetical protein
MSYETFDFDAPVYFEIAAGATMTGIQLLDGDCDWCDELEVTVRVTGDWESASRDTPESSSRDLEVVDVKAFFEGNDSGELFTAAEVAEIAGKLSAVLEANDYNEGGVV